MTIMILTALCVKMTVFSDRVTRNSAERVGQTCYLRHQTVLY